jgi:hypothetical protein
MIFILFVIVGIFNNFVCAICYPGSTDCRCTINNFVMDPTPWGGANCSMDDDCGGNDAGVCSISNNASFGVCICSKDHGMPNCSYNRTNPALYGGLNIGLAFVGIGGIGNIIIGVYVVYGIVTLVLTLCLWLTCLAIFIYCTFNFSDWQCMPVIVFFGLAFFVGLVCSLVSGGLILSCAVPDAKGYWMMN